MQFLFFFFSSRRRHTRFDCDWSSDVCSSDLQRVIIEDREKKLHPHIEIIQKKGEKEKRLRDFVIPEGAQLTVEDGQEVYAGLVLAKVSREAYKTRDITGGLSRVAELFEARRPKDPATISEVDGTVRFGEIKRGKREICVHPEEDIGRASCRERV